MMKEQLNILNEHCQHDPNFISTINFGQEIERLYIRLIFNIDMFEQGGDCMVYLAPSPSYVSSFAQDQLYSHVVAIYAEQIDRDCFTIIEKFQLSLQQRSENISVYNLKLVGHLKEKMHKIQTCNQDFFIKAQSTIANTQNILLTLRNSLFALPHTTTSEIKRAWINANKVINDCPAGTQQHALRLYSKIRSNIRDWHTICDALTHDERQRYLLTTYDKSDEYEEHPELVSMISQEANLYFILDGLFKRDYSIEALGHIFEILGRSSPSTCDKKSVLDVASMMNYIQDPDRIAAAKYVGTINEIILLAKEHKNLVWQMQRPMLNGIYVTLFGGNTTHSINTLAASSESPQHVGK